MSLGKRHIGRRVAGVGVAVALMVLGLEAPAFAVPAITAISPTSGPTDCVVVVTGTGFTESPESQTDVDFTTGTPVVATSADFAVISDTTIWAVVPGLTAGTSYNIRITTPVSPTGVTSTATFLATTGAGGCAPTITGFTPTCGPGGTTVVITGTNLIDSDLDGASVFFAPYDTNVPPDTEAVHTVPDVDDVTSLSVVVPSTTTTATNPGTVDGPIKVVTDIATGGTAFSTASFLVPPPDCVAAVPTAHARSISFKIKKSGKASGVVSSTEDPAFTDCVASVPVKIQKKKKGGGWKTVGTTTTNDTGAYTKKVKNPKGKQKFRALAPKVGLGDPVTDTCTKAKSGVRKI
jgi:hypothetical protein